MRIDTFEDLLDFIKTPKDLLKWMSKNIDYGICDKNKRKIFNPTSKEFCKKMVLQTPEELFMSRVGVCWDQCEFQRMIFDHLGIINEVIFIGVYVNKQHYNTHTFSLIEDGTKWRWFENSWYQYRRLSDKNSKENLIKLVLSKQIDSTNETYDKLILGKVANVPFGKNYKAYMTEVHKTAEAYNKLEDI